LDVAVTTAILVVDMLNTYEHEDAERLMPNVEKILDPLSDLIKQAHERDDVQLVYANDNYGDFTAEFSGIVRSALDGKRPDLVEPIVPPDGALKVTKVRHSAFFASPLEYLLRRDDIDRIVLTGQVTEQCILYSALDGYVRHFEVVVAKDAVAHIDAGLGAAALKMMEENMRADVLAAAKCLP
jgi:nicotinamidase-related amidase